MKSVSKRRAHSRGQSLVELTLILPVMLLLLIGALDLGRVFYSTITIDNAAKEAALRASSGASDGAAAGANEARGGFVTVAAGNVTITYSDPINKCSDTATFGATTTATVTAQFKSITPFVGALLGGQTATLRSASTAHCAVLPVTALVIPTATPTAPACPTVSFTTNNSNGGHPHRMDLDGSISPTSSGWSWAWSGGATDSGQHVNNHDFPASGPTSVTLTASKGACVVPTTQIVNVP